MRAILVLAALVIPLVGGSSLRAADDQREEIERLRKELDAANKRIAELEAKLERLRARRLDEPQHPPLPPVEPPLLPDDLRGKVVDVAGDLATISIGIDAGLRVGTVLEVYRPDGKKVIGTVKVTDAFNLYAKQAVVKFTPARKVPLNELSPDELPKKGDVVRPMKKKD